MKSRPERKHDISPADGDDNEKRRMGMGDERVALGEAKITPIS